MTNYTRTTCYAIRMDANPHLGPVMVDMETWTFSITLVQIMDRSKSLIPLIRLVRPRVAGLREAKWIIEAAYECVYGETHYERR